MYNRFVRQRTLVDESWGGIDVELTRRHELIPNLVETVQGYAAHERAVLEALVRAREAATAHQSDDPKAREAFEDSVGQALAQVLARVEAYPDLLASRTSSTSRTSSPSPRTGSPPPPLLQRQRPCLQHPGPDLPVQPRRDGLRFPRRASSSS